MRKVMLTYFKPSGKYYTDGDYTTDLKFEWDIFSEVRNFKTGEFPGMSDNCLWSGYILVQPENGFPALIDLTERGL